LIILDEIDSGLDIDALACLERLLAHVRRTNPTVSIIMITHYQRMLNYVRPDYVHIMHAGSITRSGGSELAQELEHKGYHGLIAHN
jgi:Fe-S cluster assembly ATP-binding protein